MKKDIARKLISALLVLVVAGLSITAQAQVVPGQADTSRYPQNVRKPPEMPPAPPHAAETPGAPSMAVPPGADKMLFPLRELQVNGVTAYRMDDLSQIWRKDVGNTISILHLYQIAAAITSRYRRDGYVLSRAYIPAQEIGDGVARISVVEGYIAEVKFEGKMPSSGLLDEARAQLIAEHPLNVKTLERQMLLLNDLPGTDFRSVLKPLPAAAPPAPLPPEQPPPPAPAPEPAPAPLLKPPPRGDVPMVDSDGLHCYRAHSDPATCEVLVALAKTPLQGAFTNSEMTMLAQAAPQDPDMQDLSAVEPAAGELLAAAAPAKPLPPQSDAPQRENDREGGVLLIILGIPRAPLQGTVSVDNGGSKYIGPWSTNAHVDMANTLLPYDQTGLTFSTDFGHELRNVELSHMTPLNANGLKLIGTIGYTKGRPGYTLAPDDVQSDTLRLGLGAGWDALRQRTENLNIYGGLDYQNADTDVLGFPFVRDHTRTLKLIGHFDKQDPYNGTSVIESTLSHGLEILGASAPDSLLLSRAKGRPDYTKIEASAFRFQQFSEDWNAVFGATGQYSAVPLLSAQEFGYGGQGFGRAYDPSEMVGDQGMAFKTEVRYDGLVDMGEGRHVQPYLFYDIGKVWNLDAGEPPQESGSSAGGGLRYPLPYGLNADLSLAEPLTRKADAPQYGNGKSPRFVMSLTSVFTH